MSNVILINPFEVPEGKEEACLAIWEAAAEYMRKQPGSYPQNCTALCRPMCAFILLISPNGNPRNIFKRQSAAKNLNN